MTLASIDPLPGVDWSAKAALGDAMSMVDDDTPIIIMMQNKDGTMATRTANGSNGIFHWLCSLQAYRIISGDK